MKPSSFFAVRSNSSVDTRAEISISTAARLSITLQDSMDGRSVLWSARVTLRIENGIRLTSFSKREDDMAPNDAEMAARQALGKDVDQIANPDCARTSNGWLTISSD